MFSLQPHAVARIGWHAKYLSLYLGARKASQEIIDADAARIEKLEKKLEGMRGRRGEERHLVVETANALRALNATIPSYPPPQPHVPLPLAMPLPAAPLSNPPAPATDELNALQATIAVTTARLVNVGTSYARINDEVVKHELKLKKLGVRNARQVEQMAEVVSTCRSLGAERGVLERMVKGKGEGEGKGKGQEERSWEEEEMVLEERAKEVIEWFGRQYPNVFGEDGGLKDAVEGTGQVMQYAQQVLDDITMRIGGRPVESEKGKEERELEEGEIEKGEVDEGKAEVDIG
ncbi:MAG: hypothetical protein Q9195_006761 [Heterodermia aff. obscurata]